MDDTYFNPDGGLGFDLDEETVKLFDSILVNIATDPELKQEFKKMQFIKALEGKAPKGKGPIQQLLEKVARIERDQLEQNMDLRRLISDLQHISKHVEKLQPTTGTASQMRPLRGLHEDDVLNRYYILQQSNRKK